jgi:hypothetical protein
MANTKGGKDSNTGGLTALKIGSRVRCTDDGVQGRITWANGIAVKIQWDDGEQVTWRRDSLADRPIDILEPAGEDEQTTAGPEPAEQGQGVAAERPCEEPPADTTALEAVTAGPEQSATEGVVPSVEAATAEPTFVAPEAAEEQAVHAAPEAAETPAPSKRQRKTSAAPKEKKLSALDAAAKVLGEAAQPMTCQELIAAMAQKGYWTSPGGKTPAATLYSGMLKEITSKGSSSRFVKVERGKFGRSGVA